ncbi:hypothetical protein HMPREF9062_2268, partial [Actinomyces sp. oral taxon 448 str. F0400]
PTGRGGTPRRRRRSCRPAPPLVPRPGPARPRRMPGVPMRTGSDESRSSRPDGDP